MYIYLNDTYRVRVDSLYFLLEKYSEVPEKKPKQTYMKWVNLGYFGRLDHLLHRILHDLLAEGEEEHKTTEEIHALFSRLEEKIDNLGQRCVTIFEKEKWYPEFKKEYKRVAGSEIE